MQPTRAKDHSDAASAGAIVTVTLPPAACTAAIAACTKAPEKVASKPAPPPAETPAAQPSGAPAATPSKYAVGDSLRDAKLVDLSGKDVSLLEITKGKLFQRGDTP